MKRQRGKRRSRLPAPGEWTNPGQKINANSMYYSLIFIGLLCRSKRKEREVMPLLGIISRRNRSFPSRNDRAEKNARCSFFARREREREGRGREDWSLLHLDPVRFALNCPLRSTLRKDRLIRSLTRWEMEKFEVGARCGAANSIRRPGLHIKSPFQKRERERAKGPGRLIDRNQECLLSGNQKVVYKG